MMRFILDCLRPTRQRAGERDISLEKVDREKEGIPNQQNHEIQELQEEIACEELGLKEEQEQRHEAQEALEKLAKQRTELKKQIELIQRQRKEERQLLLSLQEEQEELEQSVHEYEEELSHAQEELQRLQEDITQAERKVEGARVRISPLQNSISQSYAEISRAQQRLGELIAELIAVEGPVAIGISHQVGEEARTEDYTEEGSQEEEEEPEELSDQDLQLQIIDDEVPCGESARAEEPDRPNPADNLQKSSGSSSFTEITLTEVKEEEGSSPRSITPQIDSPDLEEEEEEDGSTVQSLMTQTSSRTTIGQFDFYHPDPFTDNDLFRDDLFPKVEAVDSTDGFFSDPFKGTDPFASDYLFSQFEEEQYLPVDHLDQHKSEPKPELCVPESTNDMDDKVCSDAESCSSNEMGDTGDSLHDEEQFDSTATNPNNEGLETRGECDGFEISTPICSESIHPNYSLGDVAEQNPCFTHLESSYNENPGPLELRDPNSLSVDLSNEEGHKSNDLEFNHFFPLDIDGDNVGQYESMECVLLHPQASEIHRCDPDGSERSGSPLMDIGKCSLVESKVQVRRHFSCEANMALCTETSDAILECPVPICHGNETNGFQFEDSGDDIQLNGQCSQRIKGSSIAPKFSDQERTCRNISDTTSCDGCVFELCHHYPSDTDPDTFRASSGHSEFSHCASTNSQADDTGNSSSGDYEFVGHNTLSPQLDVKNDDMDGTGTSQHSHHSSDLTRSNKQEVSETQYQYPDPFSPEQKETVHFNFSGLDDVEHNILIPITSCNAGSTVLKANDPFSPDSVDSVTVNANIQQEINLDPCHLGLYDISRCEPVGSKCTGNESFSSEPSDRASCDSSGCELGDTKVSSAQYSDDFSSPAQKNSHIPDISSVTQCGNFNSEPEDFVSLTSESKDKLMANSEPSEFKGLNSLSPEPDSDSGGCSFREYKTGCYDSSKTVSCDLRPPELMQFDPFSPEPSDAEMCDVGSESHHCSHPAFFETESNGPSQFSPWGLEPSMFATSDGTHNFEQVERCEYTPTGTSSDDSVRGHPFDSESSETTGWSLSESETSRLTDQNTEDAKERMISCCDVSEQDGCCSELNKVARSSRHSSVPDSIAEMLFGPEPNTARFYPWDLENSNTIVCDNHSPEDSPDTIRCEFGLFPGYDINGGVAVNNGASEVPSLR